MNMQNIINHLLLNFHYCEDLGLLNGRMGGVIFFKHYSLVSGRMHYSDYADSLFDSICDEINERTPVDFASGLCGIGWGIEYLIQNEFWTGNTDDILEEIDNKVLAKNILMEDITLETGLKVLLYYLLARIESFERYEIFQRISVGYLKSIECLIEKKQIHKDLNPSLMERLKRCINKCVDYNIKPIIEDTFFDNICYLNCPVQHYNLGIKNGLTGIALKNIITV